MKRSSTVLINPSQNTAIKPKTVGAAIYQAGNSLAKIRKDQGDDLAKQLIAREVVKVFEFYGAEVKQSQLTMSCSIIASEFYYLKPNEIEFAFRKGLAGKYSKVFGKFNPSYLVEWLNAYIEERAEVAATTSQNIHAELKSGEPHIDDKIDPEGIEKIADMWRAVSEKYEIEKEYVDIVSFKYSSIEAAVEQNGIEGAKERLLEMWGNEWKQNPKLQEQLDIDEVTFRMWKYNEFLNALNRCAA